MLRHIAVVVERRQMDVGKISQIGVSRGGVGVTRNSQVVQRGVDGAVAGE